MTRVQAIKKFFGDKVEVTNTECDHSTLTTGFCPHCGKSLAPMRERGEIEEMKRTIRKIIHDSKSPRLESLITPFLVEFTLDWVLGRIPNETLVKLMTERADA